MGSGVDISHSMDLYRHKYTAFLRNACVASARVSRQVRLRARGERAGFINAPAFAADCA